MYRNSKFCGINVFSANSTPNAGRLLGSASQPTGGGLFGQPNFNYGQSTKPFSFGGSNATSGGQGTGGLFGGTTSAFGTPPPTFDGFSTGFQGQSANSGRSLFGSTNSIPNTGRLLGSVSTPTGGGLYGQPNLNYHGPSTKPFSFGEPTSNTGGLLGAVPQGTGDGLFGQPNFNYRGPSTTTFSFGESDVTDEETEGDEYETDGSSEDDEGTGTTITFHPPSGCDVARKDGVSINVSTHHQCITCMREYEHKSLEELRSEDYAAGRKGSTTDDSFGITAFSFGSIPAAPTSGFNFTKTPSKPLFGTAATNSSGSLVGGVRLPNCVICFINDRNIVFQPCCHLAVCLSCSSITSDCPVCRKRIKNKIKIYVC